MAVGEEIGAAVGSLTALERLAAGASRTALAGGLAFYPVVGLTLGAVAAGLATATERVFPPAAGPADVLALVALTGARGARGLAAAAEALLRRGDAVVVRGRLRTVPGPLGIAAAAASLATVGVRVYAYHRLGGLTGRLLAASRELVETVVLVTLGVLAQLKTMK